MARVFYLGYYCADSDLGDGRYYVPSSTNKMSYIASVLSEQGNNVTIVSASDTINKRGKRKLTSQNDHLSIQYFFSLGRTNLLVKILSKIMIQLQIAIYMLHNIRTDDKVIIYHSLGYMRLLTAVTWIKRLKYVLEVEEIYSDVTQNEKKKIEEMNYFNRAQAYIFATEALDDLVNNGKKPSIIIYGTYTSEAKSIIKDSLWNDGLIHVVYAGTLDPRKGGACMAVRAAKYLSEEYHIHILGFGTDEEIQGIRNEIKKLYDSVCKVTFDGVRNGQDYVNFLKNCHIGLSTQIIGEKFNASSFPSKILSYLVNGLRVVSARIPVLERSKVNRALTYYEDNSPKALAEAIRGINLEDGFSSSKLIEELDQDFRKNIRELMTFQ